MAVNLNEVQVKIRKAGQNNVRVVPMAGQSALTGNQQIEVMEDNQWQVVADGMPPSTARDLVSQATNRVILG